MRKAALLSAAIVWIAILVFVSLRRIGPSTPHGSMIHRGSHIAAFGILGAMLLTVCRSNGSRWVVSLATLCLAYGLELRQHQIFGQALEWADVRDDGIGLILAMLLLRSTLIRGLLVRLALV